MHEQQSADLKVVRKQPAGERERERERERDETLQRNPVHALSSNEPVIVLSTDKRFIAHLRHSTS